VSREKGQELLFAAAQDLARQRGQLEEGMTASYARSVLSRTSYAIKTANGALVARLPLPDVREMLRFRQRVARRVLDFSFQRDGVLPNAIDLRRQVRLSSEEDRALVWAISQGRRYPYLGSWKRHALLSTVLLLLGVVPGVLYLLRLRRQYSTYRSNLLNLVARWRSHGKQDPDPSFFSLYDLDS
jgi:hypothetical protein